LQNLALSAATPAREAPMIRSLMVSRLLDLAPLHPAVSCRCVALFFVAWAVAMAFRAVRNA
jgi:hypothetical protein